MRRAVLLLALIAFFFTPVCAQRVKNPEHLVVSQAALPLYPTLARTARVSGSVRIKVTVKDGEVVATELISGHPLLASDTTTNIKTWKFDKPADAVFITTFIYQLEFPEASEPSNPRIELELPTLVKITARPPKPPCQDCGENLVPKLIPR
jgi:hypothetical protein